MSEQSPAPEAGESAPRTREQLAAADIAELLHTLGQPLTAINSYAQTGSFLLDSGNLDGERMQELFRKIVQQADRSFEISRQLKAAAAQLGRDR